MRWKMFWYLCESLKQAEILGKLLRKNLKLLNVDIWPTSRVRIILINYDSGVMNEHGNKFCYIWVHSTKIKNRNPVLSIYLCYHLRHILSTSVNKRQTSSSSTQLNFHMRQASAGKFFSATPLIISYPTLSQAIITWVLKCRLVTFNRCYCHLS